MQQIFAGLSIVLLLLANPPYIIDTLRGKTRPERMTWFIFSALGIIAFVSQIYLGASWSLVFSGVDALASTTVFVLSIWRGVGGHTKLDIAALVVAVIGVIIAVAAKQPIISLLGVVLADGAGTVLSIRKAFIEPGSETSITWIFTGTAALFGCLSVGRLSFELLLYPLYLAISVYLVPAAQIVGYIVHGSASGKFKG